MRRSSTWPLAAAALTIAACTPQPGTTPPTGTIDPDPVPIAAPDPTTRWKDGAAEIAWTGLAPDAPITITICGRESSDPAFVDPATSCSAASMTTIPAGTPDGTGTRSLRLFRGANPDPGTTWGCFVPGDAAPAGVDALTTCYVALVSQPLIGPARSVFVPFTLADAPVVPDPVVPDLPGGPATALGAAAVAVTATWGARHRRRPRLS